MAKYGKGGANYLPGIGKRLREGKSSFSLSIKGYTFNFASNFNDWVTYAKDKKVQAAAVMRDELARISKNVGIEAIKRCPHYSGALEHSIKSTIPEITSLMATGRATATVGVLSSWSSSYDDFISELGDGYPVSGPSLARYIHEYYDTFIGRLNEDGKPLEGYKRKLRKEAVTGVQVGSHFLTRPFYESTECRFDARGIVQKISARLYSSGARAETEIVNAELEQEAAKYDNMIED